MLIDEKLSNLPITIPIDDANLNFKEKFSQSTNKELAGHKKRVYTLDWNITGSKLASGSADTNIRVYFKIN